MLFIVLSMNKLVEEISNKYIVKNIDESITVLKNNRRKFSFFIMFNELFVRVRCFIIYSEN